MDYSVVLAVFGGVSVFNALFLGVLLLVNSNGLVKNRLLAFFFIGIGVRLSKSILFLTFGDIPDSMPALGLLGMICAGPLLLYYLKNINEPSLPVRRLYLHFAIALPLALILPFSSDTMVRWFYIATVIQMAVYLAFCFQIVFVHRISPYKTWQYLLCASLLVFWLVFLSQIFVEGRIAYLTGTIIATVMLYAILCYGFMVQKVFAAARVVKAAPDKISDIKQQLIALMEKDRIFTEHDLTIAKIAEILNVRPYLITETLNVSMRQTFPEFLNRYRVELAKEMLIAPASRDYPIEAIAYDCGFGTPSSFYSAFKKYVHETPAAFRDGYRVNGVGSFKK